MLMHYHRIIILELIKFHLIQMYYHIHFILFNSFIIILVYFILKNFQNKIQSLIWLYINLKIIITQMDDYQDFFAIII